MLGLGVPSALRVTHHDRTDHQTRLMVSLTQVRLQTDFGGKPAIGSAPFCGRSRQGFRKGLETSLMKDSLQGVTKVFRAW